MQEARSVSLPVRRPSARMVFLNVEPACDTLAAQQAHHGKRGSQ